MLRHFILHHREAIIDAARARVATRTSPKPTEAELSNGIPVFLEQLGDALLLAESSGKVDHEQLQKSASRHGQDLHRLGLTVAQVVRVYGDVCQVITQLAIEKEAKISPHEFHVLNLCLDDATAEAVTSFGARREDAITDRGTERLGELAHELRNLLHTATVAFEMVRKGQVAPGGSTALVCSRSLAGLRDLIDRSLTEVRLDAGLWRQRTISVASFLEEVEVVALVQAQARGLHFTMALAERTLTIRGDQQILAATLANLLQNAFKFTPVDGHVSLAVSATADRVLFEVADECGGLPPGNPQDLFLPFEQRGSDRSGAGLGLAICIKAAQANGGTLHVRDVPGHGCVFTLDLPRQPPPQLSVIEGGKSKKAQPNGAEGDVRRGS